jgi:hypothetical protein
LGAGLGVLAATLALPFLRVVQGDTTTHVGFHELWEPPRLVYERVMVEGLLVTGALLAASGVALVVLPPSGAWAPRMRGAASVVSLVGLVAAGRWFGFGLARALDSGPNGILLGSAPWIVLACAAAALMLTLPRRLAKGRRDAWDWLVAASVLGFLTLPLAPWGRLGGPGEWFYLDGLSLAVFAADGSTAAHVTVWALDAARFLWAADVALLVALWSLRPLAARLVRTWLFVHLATLVLIALLVGLFWIRIDRLDPSAEAVAHPFALVAWGATVALSMIALRRASNADGERPAASVTR